FERQLGCRIPFRTRLFRLNSALGVMSYVGMIATGTAAILAAALFCVAHTGIGGWILIVLGVAGLIPASDIAIAVVNRAITQLVGAAFLPGLELRDGVPPDLRSIVVVPTLLTAQSEVNTHADRSRQAADWKDGASSQPAALRSARWPGRGGPCRPSTARDSVASDRQRRLVVPARLFRSERSRSLCAGCFRRVPGPVRRRHL